MLPEPFEKDLMAPQAIARLLVPKEPVPEDDESPEEAAKKKPEEKKKPAAVAPPISKGKKEINTSKKSLSRLDNDREFEDKILTVKPVSEDLFVYVLHDAAAKEVRTDLLEFVKKQFSKDLDNVENDVLKEKISEIGTKLEATFLERFKNVPLFSF